MILEVAILNVKVGQTADFEAAFVHASPIIASMKGYRRHELRRCLESANQYVLLVEWETLEDHTVTFRQGPLFTEWRGIIGPFFAGPPLVGHFTLVGKS